MSELTRFPSSQYEFFRQVRVDELGNLYFVSETGNVLLTDILQSITTGGTSQVIYLSQILTVLQSMNLYTQSIDVKMDDVIFELEEIKKKLVECGCNKSIEPAPKPKCNPRPRCNPNIHHRHPPQEVHYTPRSRPVNEPIPIRVCYGRYGCYNTPQNINRDNIPEPEQGLQMGTLNSERDPWGGWRKGYKSNIVYKLS